MDLTEMSAVEELTQCIEKDLEINCEFDNGEDVSRMETYAASDESLEISGYEDSDDTHCRPVEEVPKLGYPHEEFIYTCIMNSRNINEILLQTYLSKVILQDDSTDSTKFKTNNSLEKVDPESSGDICNDPNFENGPTPTDLELVSSPKRDFAYESSYEDRLIDSSLLPDAFNSLEHKLKDIVQKVDELLEAMDSRPHWNRLVRKSNSPWKQNNPNILPDSRLLGDRKPKVLKHWSETRSKFERLSKILKRSLCYCPPSSELLEFLADVKSTLLRFVDFDKVQDCSNLTDNIQSAFDADSDERYMLNLERRILTIEVTLKNITFEIDKLYDDYKRVKKL